MELKGIHHVSALTANAAGNLEFYTQLLGLRLVKKTVNQDNTSSYHLFYGDRQGAPGTELTFFDIPNLAPTHRGTGSISNVGLRVPGPEALRYWQKRFAELGVQYGPIAEHGGRQSLAFRDCEGQNLMLVADSPEEGVPGGTPWEKSPVPAQWGIRGLGPVTLTVHNAEPTQRVLTDVLGFRQVGQYSSVAGSRRTVSVFATGAGGTGAEVHLEECPDLPRERLGRGGVHHVAFRVPYDEAEYKAWHERLESAGFHTSGLVDRYYFRSIYFREPGGILFELATDGPGFTGDEDIEHLGERLSLPPFLEAQRAEIEARLHPLERKLPS
jgi:glyoxalase family protein